MYERAVKARCVTLNERNDLFAQTKAQTAEHSRRSTPRGSIVSPSLHMAPFYKPRYSGSSHEHTRISLSRWRPIYYCYFTDHDLHPPEIDTPSGLEVFKVHEKKEQIATEQSSNEQSKVQGVDSLLINYVLIL